MFDATVSINLSRSYKWESVMKHAEHSVNLEQVNKNIDFQKTKYNMQGKLLNYNELMNVRYADYVKEHDAKMIKSRHKKGVYGSVENYLSKKKIRPYVTMVATFGDMELKSEFSKLFDSQNQVLKKYSEAFSNYVEGFNKRNSNFKITEYITNVDEKGAPHVHAQVVLLGVTKNKKPSSSLDAALNTQYNITDSRKALREFRAQEDQALVDSFNKSFDSSKNNLFKLKRTGKKRFLDIEDYKAAKINEERIKSLMTSARKVRKIIDTFENDNISKSLFEISKENKFQIETLNEVLDYQKKH